MRWTPEQDAELLRLNAMHLSHRTIAAQLGNRTRQAVNGRLWRLLRPDLLRAPAKPPRGQPTHERRYREIKAAKHPFATDSSCPDFAWDDLHCEAVNEHGGFPVLQRRAA